MQEMMFGKGVNFNDYPAFFKRGTFVRRVTEMVTLDEKSLKRIPEQHRPQDGQALRSRVKTLEMPSFSKVTNRVGVIFRAEAPETGAPLPLAA
jgi:tRNA(His) 5'-end guanylyltransferase